jgi:hypothetical protein
MICMACLSAPLVLLGIGSTYYNTLVGLLLTILSLSMYLHYKEFSDCKTCRTN